jgi:hypothetical protein
MGRTMVSKLGGVAKKQGKSKGLLFCSSQKTSHSAFILEVYNDK